MINKTTEKSAPSMFLTIFIGIIIGIGIFWTWNQFTSKPTSSVSQVDQAQVKELISKINKLTLLPTGEDPVVATINDASALIKEQVFYKGAINGDVVLVYQKAAKAIVYSPSRNIIVNMGPVFLQDNTSAASSTGAKK